MEPANTNQRQRMWQQLQMQSNSAVLGGSVSIGRYLHRLHTVIVDLVDNEDEIEHVLAYVDSGESDSLNSLRSAHRNRQPGRDENPGQHLAV